MNWFWLNIPLKAVIFLAMAGTPLWMVIRHPDSRPASDGATREGVPAYAGITTVARTTGRPAVPTVIRHRRELVGASAGDRG